MLSVRALMDNLLAVGLGLAVRHVVNVVGRADVRMAGTLVGMWEGAVLSHLLRKSGTALDPLLGYAVRLFVDYSVSENLTRLVLTVVWTGLGIILADIAPALWVDVGLHRYWRRFRRNVDSMSRSMPSVDVDFFPRARTVRFSPRPTTAVLTDTDSTATPVSPRSPAAAPRPHSKRHVPGSFESDTDTITDPGSVRLRQSELLQPRRRQSSVFPSFATVFRDSASDATSVGHVDEGNISSPLSEGGTEDLSAANPSEIPDELELEYIDTKPEEGTPKQRNIGLPTPTDSLHPFDPMRHDDDYIRPPPTADIRTIPDTYDDWENITKSDAENAPPFLPEKVEEQPPAKESPAPHPVPPPVSDRVTSQNTTFMQESVLPEKFTPTRQSTMMSEVPPPYQDTYEFTDPLTEKLLVGDAAKESEPSASQEVADEEQAKSEHGETKSVASDLSAATLNNLLGLECLEQMARLHQLFVKSKEDYESAVQRHKAVQTSGNKALASRARTEMDAYDRKLKNITNKAEVCYLTRTFPSLICYLVSLPNSPQIINLKENCQTKSI
jgi:hypothetical protein